VVKARVPDGEPGGKEEDAARKFVIAATLPPSSSPISMNIPDPGLVGDPKNQAPVSGTVGRRTGGSTRSQKMAQDLGALLVMGG